jgi:hypothetical protein
MIMEWKNTLKVLDDIGVNMIDDFRKKLNQPDPYSSNATFTLYNSVNYKVVADSSSLKLLFTAPDEYYDKVSNKLYLEQGRKAGSKAPPISVIKKWVIDRSINASPYAIQRSISIKGIKPKPYLSQIREEIVVGGVINRLEQAIVDDINEYTK